MLAQDAGSTYLLSDEPTYGQSCLILCLAVIVSFVLDSTPFPFEDLRISGPWLPCLLRLSNLVRRVWQTAIVSVRFILSECVCVCKRDAEAIPDYRFSDSKCSHRGPSWILVEEFFSPNEFPDLIPPG